MILNFFFFFFSKKKKNGSVGRWETKHFMGLALGEHGLQSIDVGGAGDCLFRSVSHQLYGNSNHHMRIRTAGVRFMRDNQRDLLRAIPKIHG